MTRTSALLVLVLAGCSGGTSGPADAGSVTPAPDGGGPSADGAVDAPARADSGADGAMPDSAPAQDAAPPSGPTQLVDAAPGMARIPGWDPTAPFPVTIVVRYSGTSTWVASAMANIEPDGTVDNVVNVDRIVVFGLLGVTQPAFDGAVGGVSVPSWSASTPPPVVLLARYAGTSRWVASMASVESNGTVDGLVNVDRLVGWTFLTTAPPPAYQGPFSGASVSGWNPASPSPLITLAHHSGTSQWWVTMITVESDGRLDGLVNVDQLVAWRF